MIRYTHLFGSISVFNATMENIEKNVVLLLNGKDAEEPQDFCDFTLEDQNEAASKFLLL